MALQKTVTLTSNFGEEQTFTNAYIKVARVSGTKTSVSAVVEIRKEVDGTLLHSESHVFDPSMNADNFIKQAYNHIKTLPDYSDATDI
tara:strand:+ start:169 stop:432 length:264 start_codon:yes stop_codon:yes gene_type:complete